MSLGADAPLLLCSREICGDSEAPGFASVKAMVPVQKGTYFFPQSLSRLLYHHGGLMAQHWEFEILADKRFDSNFTSPNGRTWFRIDCSMVDSAKWERLSLSARVLWIHLLARGASKSSRLIQLTPKQLSSAARTKPSRCLSVARELVDVKWIRIVAEPSHKTSNPDKVSKIVSKKEDKKVPFGDKTQKQDNAKQESLLPTVVGQPIEKANVLIALYCDRWKERYNSKENPVIQGKDAKAIKSLMERVGAEQARRMIEAYLAMPNSWFVTKHHDITTLMQNLNQVTQFLSSGKVLTKTKIKELEEKVDEAQGDGGAANVQEAIAEYEEMMRGVPRQTKLEGKV